MRRLLSSEGFLSHSPLLSAVLYFACNLGLLGQMWMHHSAAGHSMGAWGSAVVSQALWVNYYRHRVPNEFWTNLTAVLALAFLAVMFGSVVYFQM